MRSDPKSRALDNCLSQIESGAGLEQALRNYPQWAADLRPLVQTSQAARWLGEGSQILPGAQAQSLDQLLELARQSKKRRKAIRGFSQSLSLVLLGLVLALFACSGGLVWFSRTALPGEMLYPIKMTAENIQESVPRNASNRVSLEQQADQRRLNEVKSLILRGRSAEVDFTGGLSQMQMGEWLVGGVRVLVPADTQLTGQIRQGMDVRVIGKLQLDGVVVARQVLARQLEIEGTLERVEPDRWLVAGVWVTVSPETILEGEPKQGDAVLVKALRLLDGSLLARLVDADAPEVR